jgi:hypothetical protein
MSREDFKEHGNRFQDVINMYIEEIIKKNQEKIQKELIKKLCKYKSEKLLAYLKQWDDIEYPSGILLPIGFMLFKECNNKKACEYMVKHKEKFELDDTNIIEEIIDEIKSDKELHKELIWKVKLCKRLIEEIDNDECDDSQDSE